MKRIIIVYMMFTLILFGCTKVEQPHFSFYHWKAKALYTNTYQQAFKAAQSQKVFLHFFDIDILQGQKTTQYNKNIFPTYILQKVDANYKKMDIVPVVFINNHIFQEKDFNTADLAQKIRFLINQISNAHFGSKLNHIQIDCDWSQSTKNLYFELLTLLQNDFTVDVTIRLHQIKYAKKTGVPPVSSGTLMLYNVGDLKNKNQNSILENAVVKQYIMGDTTYPMSLNIALPLFSQTVIINPENQVKIIRNAERTMFENDSHFKKIDNTTFGITHDTLYKGFFLTKGYTIKLEEWNENELLQSYKTIKNSKLVTSDVIFYYLDDTSLKIVNLPKWINKL